MELGTREEAAGQEDQADLHVPSKHFKTEKISEENQGHGAPGHGEKKNVKK